MRRGSALQALAFTWAAAIDLLLDCVLGTLWFWLIFSLMIAGVATLPAFGLGLVFLGLGAWLTRYTGRVEVLRANALLGTAIAQPVRPLTEQTGWKRPFAQGIADLRDGQTWRILLHHFASFVLGTVMVFVLWATVVAAVDLIAGTRSYLTAPFASLAEPVRVSIAIAGLLAVIIAIYFAGRLDRAVLAPLLGPASNAELREQVTTLSGARQAAVDAAALERQRIERDLHDGAQPRLVSVAMTLGMAKAKLDSDPAAARALLEQAHSDAKLAITDLRQLARGIHPAVLTDRGLDAALSALASRNPVPTRVEVNLAERQSPEIEAVVYFAIAEALTNVTKHSGASVCSVTVTCADGRLTATVADDGSGGARIDDDGGLAGIVARVRAAGGTVGIFSPAGGPTELELELPCVS
jgi:signal transduction histidine kinase